MQTLLLLLSIAIVIFVPFWAYRVYTDKSPVRTDEKRLDKLFVVTILVISVSESTLDVLEWLFK